MLHWREISPCFYCLLIHRDKGLNSEWGGGEEEYFTSVSLLITRTYQWNHPIHSDSMCFASICSFKGRKIHSPSCILSLSACHGVWIIFTCSERGKNKISVAGHKHKCAHCDICHFCFVSCVRLKATALMACAFQTCACNMMAI